MKKTIALLLSAVMIFAFCFTAFGQETESEKSYYPVVGSWILDKVYEVKEGQEPSLMKKEENQSLYGAGLSVFTFDESGTASETIFDGEDMADVAASWTSTAPKVFEYTDENDIKVTFVYNSDEDTLARKFEDFSFIYARAFVGSWKLDKVLEIHEGDAPEELAKESNQSLYGTDESILTFTSDGKGQDEIKEGPNASKTEGTWEMTEPDKYVYTDNGLQLTFDYFRVEDTLLRDVKDDAPDAAHPFLRFIYVRVVEEPEKEEQPAEAKTAEQKSEKPTEKPAPKKTGRSLDLSAPEGGGLIVTIYETTDGKWVDAEGMTYTKASDTEWFDAKDNKWVTGEYFIDNPVGKVFTGNSMYLYAPEGGGVLIEVQGLTDGRYTDTETGVIYEQEGGGGYHFYGDDGSVWVTEAYFEENPVGSNGLDEDELIADGQIFTGYRMYLYAPEGGGLLIEVQELTDGRYTDTETGVIYEQEVGGGYHFYGNDGSVWVTEAYFAENPVGSNGFDDDYEEDDYDDMD